MADQLKARPFSGEIMTGPKARPVDGMAAAFDAAGDIVDADFVTLPPGLTTRDTPPLSSSPPPAQPATPPGLGGMGMLRKAEARPARPFSKRGGPAFWAVGACLAATAFWIAGGHALAGYLAMAGQQDGPHSALGIFAVTSRVDRSGGHPVLFVDGEAGNDGAASAPLPPLEISVTGHDGRVTRYRLGTSGRELAPGERFGFSSRVEVPRNGVRTVSVAFAG